MRGWWLALLVVLGSTTGSHAQQPPVEMKVIPLFGVRATPNGAFPVAVEVRSHTRPLRGVLVVRVGEWGVLREYRYPLELPAGSRKLVVATPIMQDYAGTVEVTFTGGGYRVSERQNVEVLWDADTLVVNVGDILGGLQNLTQIGNRQVSRWSKRQEGKYLPTYCPPERFPESAIALSGVSIVILHPGAERLNAEQWNALRQWVALGGVLIAPGGAGALYLQSPSLRPLLPVEVQQLTQLPNLPALGAFAKAKPLRQPVSVVRARPVAGTVLLRQGNLPLIALRPYGLGAVVFLAFHPAEEPLRSYEGINQFWKALLYQLPSRSPSRTINAIFRAQSGEDPNSMGRWNSGQFSRDIQLKVPDLAIVFLVLTLYFFLVVPINYWVLKRFRALDWAWVTTPLIALVFVGVLARFTSGLYRKPLSADIQSVLLVSAGASEAYSVNSALLFFPRAGLYDLRFDRAELVEQGTPERTFWSAELVRMLSTLEGDPKIVQDYRVRNLSFQWFRYTRYVDLGGHIEAQLRLQRNKRSWLVKGRIRNRFRFPLKQVVLRVGDEALLVGDLAPGASRTVSQRVRAPKPPATSISDPFFSMWGSGSFDRSDYVGGLEEVFVQTQYAWFRRVSKAPVIYLTAESSEPVLAPDMRDQTRRTARNTLWVPIPVEVIE